MENSDLLKLFWEWEEEGIKENGKGENSSIIYFIYYKNICKCHNVPPPPSTTIKKRGKKVKCLGLPYTIYNFTNEMMIIFCIRTSGLDVTTSC
jgi:hypothetical protein